MGRPGYYLLDLDAHGEPQLDSIGAPLILGTLVTLPVAERYGGTIGRESSDVRLDTPGGRPWVDAQYQNRLRRVPFRFRARDLAAFRQLHVALGGQEDPFLYVSDVVHPDDWWFVHKEKDFLPKELDGPGTSDGLTEAVFDYVLELREEPVGPTAVGGVAASDLGPLSTIASGAATFAPSLAAIFSLSTIGPGATTQGPTLSYAVSASTISTSATFNVPNVTGSSGDEETMRLAEGRLTLQSGSPVATADQVGKSNIYWSPFMGNRLALYSGGVWVTFPFSEFFVALSGLTSGKLYDIFAYDNAGTPAMEVGPVWTNDTTRATALSLQDGVLVKSGDATRRYLGTFRTTGTTTTEDSQGGTSSSVGGKRFLWNYYNRIDVRLAVYDQTTTWTYASATIRQANGNAGNKIEWIAGVAEDLIDALLLITIQSANSSSATVGFGLDSTTVFNTDTQRFQLSGTTSSVNMHGARYVGRHSGYHALNWLESIPGAATTTFIGSNASSVNNGISAIIKA